LTLGGHSRGREDVGMYDDVLRAQWGELRRWIEAEGVLEHADDPSVLAGWTVRDLMAHTGRSFLTATATTAADGEEPGTLLAYVGGYGRAAGEIADGTRALSVELADDLLGGLDRIVVDGFAAMAGLPDGVVRGPRGLIRRDDFVVTRILELVVHGDDLARSVPSVSRSPLLDDAVTIVARSLADGYEHTTGHRPSSEQGIGWIRAATGRVVDDDPRLPLL